MFVTPQVPATDALGGIRIVEKIQVVSTADPAPP